MALPRALRRREVCGRGMPLPYALSGNDRPHGKAGCRGKLTVGADSISARGVCGAADRADIESAPTRVRDNARIMVSRFAAAVSLAL